MNLNSRQTTCLLDCQPSAARGTQKSHPTKVLLVGASGFIGSRILLALLARDSVVVSILTRRPPGLFSESMPTVLLGDVTDPASVRDAARHADVVINASSYVGNDPFMAHRVNHQGTLSIIRACKSSNVRRLIHVSTTAVYGSGPHRSIKTGEAQYRPASAVSRSRAIADHAVLSSGGIVVRPSLIYGAGDRWFIPGTARMFKTLGTTIEGGRAMLSTIHVVDLGLLVAALAVTSSPAAGAFHAAYQTPVTLANLLAAINQHIIPLGLEGSSSIVEAVHTLEPAGFSPHQIRMLGQDHHYESEELWGLAGIQSTGFRLTPEAQAWYRSRET